MSAEELNPKKNEVPFWVGYLLDTFNKLDYIILSYSSMGVESRAVWIEILTKKHKTWRFNVRIP